MHSQGEAWVRTAIWLAGVVCLAAAPVVADARQVDQERAATYFKEAAALCEREGGRLWGVSLCGPMVIADAATRSIATNQPAPDASRPAALGFANAAMNWGGIRWSTYVWSIISAGNAQQRARLMMHELFHRVQPELKLFVGEGQNDHLDTLEGRYWLQLEWRALAKALGASGVTRLDALRDALAFRAARRAAFPEAAENERRVEINEGLAQYTGTVTSVSSAADATSDAIAQLEEAPQHPTFLRSFAYPTGAAYGILLDGWSPGWTRRISATDDIGQLVMTAAKVQAFESADDAAKRYGGPALRVVEEKRDAEQKVRVADLRRRFVEGPVVTLPRGRNASFTNTGMTPIPGAGTIYASYRVKGDWGTLEAANVLVSPDGNTLTLPGPARVDGATLAGADWTITLAAGWVARPGARAGDTQVVRQDP
jgi:hypothetical protein